MTKKLISWNKHDGESFSIGLIIKNNNISYYWCLCFPFPLSISFIKYTVSVPLLPHAFMTWHTFENSISPQLLNHSRSLPSSSSFHQALIPKLKYLTLHSFILQPFLSLLHIQLWHLHFSPSAILVPHLYLRKSIFEVYIPSVNLLPESHASPPYIRIGWTMHSTKLPPANSHPRLLWISWEC